MTEFSKVRRQEYEAYINSPEWAVIRKAAYRRAEGRCNRCKRRGVLHAHHLTYARFGGGELPEDLEVLCQACHTAEHAPQRKEQKKKRKEERRKQKKQRKEQRERAKNLLPLDDPAYLRVMEMQRMRRGQSLAPPLPPPRQFKDSDRKKAEKRRKKLEKRKQAREERAQYLIANPLPPPIRPSRELATSPRRLVRLADGSLVRPNRVTDITQCLGS